MTRILGVDIGTTSLKACVFDEKGNELESKTLAYDLITEGNFIEFPADKYYDLFESAFTALSKNGKIDALAIDTQGETIIFCDENGVPLMNAIVWLDNRADKEAKELEEHFGLKTVYEITGQTEVPAGYPCPKILWLKRNKPEIFSKVKKIFLLEDYLLFKLTGKFVAERSLLSSSLYLNVATGEYWQEMLEYLGVTTAQLPELKESGEYVGEYKGAKVSTGALDQIAGFIGAGINEEGKVSEMTGTCLAVCALSNKIPPYYEGIKVPAHYVSKGKYCLLMWAPTAGMALEWYKKNFCEGLDYGKINELASQVPFGSEGLTIVPNMCGSVMPDKDELMTGGVYGVELKHTKGHFIRAIMESVACLLRQYIEHIDLPIKEITSIGGGSKSKLWLQIKADVTGKKILTLSKKETGCLGTAILAGAGAGIYESKDSAVKELVEIESITESNETRESADKLYSRFTSLNKLFLSRDKNIL